MPRPTASDTHAESVFHIETQRFAYAKGALSALGVAAVLVAMGVLFGVPPIDASLSIDQIIWLVAIFIFVMSLRDFAISIVTMLRGPLSVFRIEDEGVRIGGAAIPVPWRQIVSIELRRDEGAESLNLTVRPPAPAPSWLATRVYGLTAAVRADIVTYSISRERVAPSDRELDAGLQIVAKRLALTQQ